MPVGYSFSKGNKNLSRYDGSLTSVLPGGKGTTTKFHKFLYFISTYMRNEIRRSISEKSDFTLSLSTAAFSIFHISGHLTKQCALFIYAFPPAGFKPLHDF